MRKLLLSLLVLIPVQTALANPHHCSKDAIQSADKLLRFHLDEDDDSIYIDEHVKILPSIVNPRNPRQRFDVLEVWGYVYKGEYRMRFIYAQEKDYCYLMGQEILEYASL